MSRGPDDIIREYLQREGASRDNAQWAAEEILEALEAEGYLAVHKDCVRTYSEARAAAGLGQPQ
jgi:hypothetical protein